MASVRRKRAEKLGTLDVLILDEVRRHESSGWCTAELRACRRFCTQACSPAACWRAGGLARLWPPWPPDLPAPPAAPAVQVSMLSAELFQYVVEKITTARRLYLLEELNVLGANGPQQVC